MIRRLSTLADAHRLDRIVVIIDVFRSSNTILELLNAGAESVLPIESEDEARRLKALHPDWLLFGERDGVRLPNFDGDNSPIVQRGLVAGKTVVLTTSGGTRAVAACGTRRDVLAGSFANASTVADMLRADGRSASLWAVGQKAATPAEEDEICAEYIETLVNGGEADQTKIAEDLRRTRGAQRLRDLGQLDDLEYCLTFDTSRLVPRLAHDGGDIPRFLPC